MWLEQYRSDWFGWTKRLGVGTHVGDQAARRGVVRSVLACTSIGRFVFFFSSRRRHTRFDCDWSSDVCSSDLDAPDARPLPPVAGEIVFDGVAFKYGEGPVVLDGVSTVFRPGQTTALVGPSRSEERRVGKSVDLGGRRIIKKKKTEQRWTSGET